MEHEQSVLKTLIDFEELRDLFVDFSDMTGLPIGLIDPVTSDLLLGIGWMGICQKFYRACPESESHCRESNKRMRDGMAQVGEIRIDHCQHGFVEACTPIIVGGNYLADLITGQIFFSPPDLTWFKVRAKKYGFDEELFLKGLNAVPIVEEKRIHSFLTYVSKSIILNAERKLALQLCNANNKKHEVVLDKIAALAPIGIGVAVNRAIQWTNIAMSKLTGYPMEELVGLKGDSLYPKLEDYVLFGEIYKAQIKENGISYQETQWIKKDGTLIDVIVGSTPMGSNNSATETIFTALDITEKKQIYKLLKQSEERFHLATETAHFGLWDWNILTNDVFYNDQYFNALGFSPSDFPQTTEAWTMLLHPDDQDWVLDKIQSALHLENPSWSIEFRMKSAAEGDRWISCQGKVVEYTDDGSPRRAIGIHQDITQKKLDEHIIRESESQYRELFNNMDSGVVIFSAIDGGNDFIIDDFNRAAQTTTKLTPKDVLGKSLFQGLPHTVPELFDAYRRVYKTGSPESLPLINYQTDSISLWAHCHICKLPSGRIVAILNDMTEQKQAEEQLKSKHLQLEQIVDLAPDAFLLMDEKGTILMANQQAVILSGYSSHDLIGQKLTSLFLAGEKDNFLLRFSALKKGGILVVERQFLAKQGSALPVEITCKMMPDGAFQCFIQNISEKKLSQETLLKSQRDLKKLRGQLNQANSALDTVMMQAEQQKRDLEATIAANILGIIEPHLNKLKKTGINKVQDNHLKIIESTFKDITSPFVRTSMLMDLKLSPAELQVANLIKQGKKSKGIAELLGLSVQTVDKHRSHIRKKLGINNKDISLMEILTSK